MVVHVNADNFARAESDLMFSRLLADAGGVGKWVHFREPTPLDHQPVIRMNRDTLYSGSIVDVSGGATLTLPEAGTRYLSAMIVTQDHYIPDIFHGPGTFEVTPDAAGTDYVLVGVRTLVDPNDPTDVAQVNDLQDQLTVTAASARPFVLPEYDADAQTRTRKALLDLAAGLPDLRRAFGNRDDVDQVRHLICSASAWGGLPESEAHYLNISPNLPVGDYTLRLTDVPVDGFWSVSLYNAEGYFEPNAAGVNNVNSVTAVRDPDGAVTVNFGVERGAKANFLTVMDGWNLLLRMYLPRPEVLDGRWAAPAIEPA